MNNLFEIILSLLVGLISVYIEKFIKIFWSSNAIKRIREFKLFIIHSIITYLIWQLGDTIVTNKVFTILSGLSFDIRIIFIIVINILMLLTHIKFSQIGGKVDLKYDIYEFSIHKLKQLTKNKKQQMTWETLKKGLEDINKMIHEVPKIRPNIIFGVNETGLIAASYLSHHIQGDPRVGVIKTGAIIKKKEEEIREIIQFDCPNPDVEQFDKSVRSFSDIAEPTSIAIVDAEIKSGRSTKLIIEKLCEKYNNPEIIYIVLCGVLKHGDEGKKIDDIEYFGWKTRETIYKPDFMAFYINFPGVRGPDGMR